MANYLLIIKRWKICPASGDYTSENCPGAGHLTKIFARWPGFDPSSIFSWGLLGGGVFLKFLENLGCQDENCMEKAKYHWELSCQKFPTFPTFLRIQSYHHARIAINSSLSRLSDSNLRGPGISPTHGCLACRIFVHLLFTFSAFST